MNNYQDWAQLVAKKLQGEADIIAAIEKDELDDAAAADAFARAVLEPFLPENFGIGSGRVVDAFGNYSDQLDLIVYNRDFPRIGMRGVHATYLYESVLACFAVRAKFIRKTFFDSLDACASLADLETNVDKQVMTRLAAKNGMQVGPNNTFTHEDALRAARFELIGRPPAFVFGFSGFKYSHRQLQENLELWFDNRQQEDLDTPMKALPGVIATQGCFAWRNAAPLALSNREMLGVGADEAPVRLIVLQMLYLLNRRLNVTADGYGLKPSLKAYLNQFDEPKFEVGVGKVRHPSRPARTRPARRPEQPTADSDRAARDTGRFEIAKDRARPGDDDSGAKAGANAAAPAAAGKPAAPEIQTPPPAEPVKAAAKTRPQPAPQRPPAAPTHGSTPAPTFQARPNAPAAPPLGSAPIPNTTGGRPAAPPLGSAPIPNTSSRPAAPPLGSAPIPARETETAANRPAAPPLGSAPIPPMHKANDTVPVGKPATAVIPPKPPIDIDIGAESAPSDGTEEDVLANTVIIPPPDGSGKPAAGKGGDAEDDDKPRNSTNDFIARVKRQLANSEPLPDQEQDFTSTIPQ